MLFKRFSRFSNERDLQKAMDSLGATYMIFPVIDPESEGGQYLRSGAAHDDFNVATEDAETICYWDKEVEPDFDAFKACLASRLVEVAPEITKQLYRSGFLVFSPGFERAMFWPLDTDKRSPTEDEVFFGLSKLKSTLNSPIHKVAGLNRISAALDEGIAYGTSPEGLRATAKALLKSLFPFL